MSSDVEADVNLLGRVLIVQSQACDSVILTPPLQFSDVVVVPLTRSVCSEKRNWLTRCNSELILPTQMDENIHYQYNET